MMFRLTTIVALVGFVSANSYSIGCMNTLMNLGNNPDVANCLAPNLLLPILVGAGNGPDSVVSPVDAWITGMCAQPACTDDVLNTVVNQLTSGCSAEFALPQAQSTLNVVKGSYSALRNVMCLVDSSTNCVTQTLKNMEAAWGTMNLNDQNIATLASNFAKGLPSNVLCTDCMKGALTLATQGIPSAISDANKQYASQTCGAAFVDGGMPPNLFQSAFDPNNSNGNPPTTTSSSASSTMTGTPLSVSSAKPTSTAKPNTQRKNGAVGGPSTTPFVNLAATGLVVVLTGMALL